MKNLDTYIFWSIALMWFLGTWVMLADVYMTSNCALANSNIFHAIQHAMMFWNNYCEQPKPIFFIV